MSSDRSPSLSLWRVQITVPGAGNTPGKTETHDIEAHCDWQANPSLLRRPGIIPIDNRGYTVTISPLQPEPAK